jgi:hypothetical protein
MLRPQCAFERQSARRVLQFTPVIVASYVLHQSISRVIHGKQLCLLFFKYCMSWVSLFGFKAESTD